MKYNILENVLKSCQEQSAIILSLYNEDESLINLLYDYNLLGSNFNKLCNLCGNSYDLIKSSLILINYKKELTKEVVHQNLNLDNPVEFVVYTHTGEYDSLDMYCDLNYAFFKKEFDKVKKRGR